MCGICGQAGPAAQAAVVGAMNGCLTHRGPDSAGSFSEPGIALAMSRLAILDLDHGDQPMFSEDEEVVVIHNGEIYNFAELREALEAKGHVFRTTTDTEVLVHGYEQWGADLVPRLEGMFAFAIWDRRERRLLMARDRFGEKPLFFHHHPDGTLSFSSELTSLLADRSIERSADNAALGLYLRVGFVPEPRTGFRGTRSLAPGTILEWHAGQVSQREYFTPSFAVDARYENDEDAAEACLAALERAVRRQMVSDVPLGAFLSGGIDSSTVVAVMQRVSPRPVHTFTVRFADQRYDESAVARQTAARLGTRHQEIEVPNASFAPEDLWRIVDHVGQPFYDSSAIPTYLLCREVKKHVKVALTGDGGDEMFAGYPFFRWARLVQALNQVPHPLLRAAGQGVRHLARQPRLHSQTVLRQVRRAIDAASADAEAIPARVLSVFDGAELDELLIEGEARASACGDLQQLTALPEEAVSWTPLRRLMYYRIRNNLVGDMLTKIDRMSMACSLELRAPMLDLEVARFAASLPDRQLRRGGRGKEILRRAMRPHLPAAVFDKPKQGFSIPLHRYWGEAFPLLARELLGPQGPLGGVVDAGAVDRLMRQATMDDDTAMQSVYRASHQLWSVVVLAAWAERFEVRF